MHTTSQLIDVRTVTWSHPDAVWLREAMSREIGPRYADRIASFPAPPEMEVEVDELVYVGLAYRGNGLAVGHVAVRRLGDDLEIKKLFVRHDARGQGVGRALLHAAEQAARELGAHRIILQTGDRQPEAVALYENAGYTRIPIFAPYVDLTYSLCFDKQLSLDVTAVASR